jgi:hypothetical protein
MDAYILYTIVAALGGFFGVVFPYILKVYENPTLKFDFSYVWSLIVAMLVAVTVLIPKGIEFDITTAITLFFACLGITVPMNKVSKAIVNKLQSL